MKPFVFNVVFDKQKQYVLTILKNKPSYLAGKYNFIGGKVESEDTDNKSAAIRETIEEAGIKTKPEYFGSIIQNKDPAFKQPTIIYLFRDFTDNVFNATSKESEQVHVFRTYKFRELFEEKQVSSIIPYVFETALMLPKNSHVDIVI